MSALTDYFEMKLPQFERVLDTTPGMTDAEKRHYRQQLDAEKARRTEAANAEARRQEAIAYEYTTDIDSGLAAVANGYDEVATGLALGDLAPADARKRLQMLAREEQRLQEKEDALLGALTFQEQILADPVQWFENLYERYRSPLPRWTYPK